MFSFYNSSDKQRKGLDLAERVMDDVQEGLRGTVVTEEKDKLGSGIFWCYSFFKCIMLPAVVLGCCRPFA
jgi:hypothetical protein